MVQDLRKLPEMQDVLEFDESLYELVGFKEENTEKLTTTPYSYWKSVWKQLFKNKIAIFCIVLLVVLLFFTFFGPMIHGDPGYNRVNPMDPRSQPIFCTPNSSYWFGADISGKDIWTRIWVGAQFSLKLAIVVSLIDVVLGLIIGGFWGYIRWLDPIMIEISNVISNIPTLLIYILVLELLPSDESWGFWNAIIVMTMFGWMGLASTMRNQIIIIRNREFNIASETLGSKPTTIIIHNLLPNLVSIIAQVVIDYIPATIASEVSLIYFGVFPAKLETLGKALEVSFSSKSISNGLAKAPNILIFPALIMILLTISFFYFGLAVADATDPRRHR